LLKQQFAVAQAYAASGEAKPWPEAFLRKSRPHWVNSSPRNRCERRLRLDPDDPSVRCEPARGLVLLTRRGLDRIDERSNPFNLDLYRIARLDCAGPP
jgi:hypothetical protein